MNLKVSGLYNHRIIKQLNELGINSFEFDFRPRSFNFIQKYVLEEIIKEINLGEKIFLHFANEVDFIINDKELAIEVKGSARVHSGDIKGLKALLDDGPVKKALLVCLEKEPRYITKDIQIMPFKMFLQQLWDGVYF